MGEPRGEQSPLLGLSRRSETKMEGDTGVGFYCNLEMV